MVHLGSGRTVGLRLAGGITWLVDQAAWGKAALKECSSGIHAMLQACQWLILSSDHSDLVTCLEKNSLTSFTECVIGYLGPDSLWWCTAHNNAHAFPKDRHCTSVQTLLDYS